MINPEFYKALEDRLGPVVSIAGGSAIVLHILGYLSTRFHLRALGLEPDLEILSEIYIFEGAELVIYLLTLLPFLLASALVLAILRLALRQVTPFRNALDSFVAFIHQVPPVWAATIGALWGGVTVQFFMRHVLTYRDVVHAGVPCHPPWLLSTILSQTLGQSLFFCVLLLLPIPTLWALRHLVQDPAWKPAATLLTLVSLAQLILIPVHYGVLVSDRSLPRVKSEAATAIETWQVFRSEQHVHLLVREKDAEHPFRLRIVPAKEWPAFEIEAVDELYEILTHERECRR